MTPEIETAQDKLGQLHLDEARYRADVIKWIVAAVGAIVSFAVIDYGKLQLERSRATAENQRELLIAYLKATESPEPEVWKRKLHLVANFTDDQRTRSWVDNELEHIENFAELDTLYRETLKVASQLVEPGRLSATERIQARSRYNQLYWADLPYAGESQEVIGAMIDFRKQLLIAEATGTSTEGVQEWELLNSRLIELSTALKASSKQKIKP